MKEKIKIFLDTDLLEKYLLGTTSTEESLRVEHYIAMYPEVRESYNELQENIEAFAKIYTRKTPENFKEQLLLRIKQEKHNRNRFYKNGIVACITALIFVAIGFFCYQVQNLKKENTMVSTKIINLENNMKTQLEDIRNQYIVLNNPNTRRYTVNGNKKAKELKAVAYINPVKKLSYINVSNLPQLPDDKCFQMWAEVNGQMVNLGIIKQFKDKEKLLALPYADNAFSYITIEPQGGNKIPTVQNIVANFKY